MLNDNRLNDHLLKTVREENMSPCGEHGADQVKLDVSSIRIEDPNYADIPVVLAVLVCRVVVVCCVCNATRELSVALRSADWCHARHPDQPSLGSLTNYLSHVKLEVAPTE